MTPSDRQPTFLLTQHGVHGPVILPAVDVYPETDGLGPGQVTAKGSIRILPIVVRFLPTVVEISSNYFQA